MPPGSHPWRPSTFGRVPTGYDFATTGEPACSGHIMESNKKPLGGMHASEERMT